MNLSQEPNYVFRVSVVVEQLVVQTQSRCPGRSTDCGQCRDSVVAVPGVLYRRFAPRCPDASPERLKQIATFIEKNQASFAIEALFLAAAKHRGASARLLFRRVPSPAALASVGSSQVSEATGECSLGGNQPRTAAGSCHGPTGPSTQTVCIPSIACHVTRLISTAIAGYSLAANRVHDWVLIVTCRRGANSFAIATRKIRSTRQSWPRRSTASPWQIVSQRFADAVPMFLGNLLVSCPKHTKSQTAIPFSR